MATERCGYVHNVDGISGIGPACCWRPVRDEDDRCVWHTEQSVKKEAYEELQPVPGERLDGARFHGASLSSVEWLADCILVGGQFDEAILEEVDLSGADLRQATFRNVNARGAVFDRATLQDASFTVVDLRESSFSDARLYRLNLTDVRIDRETEFDDTVWEEERFNSNPEHPESDYTAAVWVYRELRYLFKNNAMEERSREYYIRGQDLRRRYTWTKGDYGRALFLEGSRWVMGYGTSPWRILATSAILIVVSAVLYPLTGGIREVEGDQTITYAIADPETAPRGYQIEVFLKSLYFSVVTFSSLGYGDIQPVGGAARLIASVETLLGTLLMALLIFVLTRRLQ